MRKVENIRTAWQKFAYQNRNTHNSNVFKFCAMKILNKTNKCEVGKVSFSPTFGHSFYENKIISFTSTIPYFSLPKNKKQFLRSAVHPRFCIMVYFLNTNIRFSHTQQYRS